MTLPADILETPRLPLDQDGGPVFSAPWEARVFAMTLQAHRAGVFSWGEWAQALGVELAKDGDGSGDTVGYYDRWIDAFEKLLREKDVAASGELKALKAAWDEAARETPHGQPIVLKTTDGTPCS
ncbi:nitrile hydratase accessory protein [Roseibium aggregatum]|uniref:nitrile hydratase accessory protein n=1 Tax=Roseibium aggregatum TaxID=187304 RepID=UPI002E2AFBD7|nr:nitrile hydratase accessory protein [Roseibium aggregatum]